MKFATFKRAFPTVLLTLFLCANSFCQNSGVTVSQDPKFEQMMAEKRKINSSITVNDRYKIQVFNGESEASKKTLADFRRDFKSMDATIVFNTPTYKVWAGNFRTRIEAERNLAEVKKKYPNALLIKPNK